MQWKSDSSRFEAGTSGFLSFSDVGLGLCMLFQTGSQVSTCVEAWNSAFLSNCQRGFRLPSKLNLGPGALFELLTRISEVSSCCELILGPHSNWYKEIRPDLEWNGEISGFRIMTRPPGSPPMSSRYQPVLKVRRGCWHSFPGKAEQSTLISS